MKYSLLKRQRDLVPYPHRLPRAVGQWQSEKQTVHLMEMIDKAAMLLPMKIPFRHVWMLYVVVDPSTMFTLYEMESSVHYFSRILMCIYLI